MWRIIWRKTHKKLYKKTYGLEYIENTQCAYIEKKSLICQQLLLKLISKFNTFNAFPTKIQLELFNREILNNESRIYQDE